MKTLLFWDTWHLEHQDNLQLCQGQPELVPEATYEDPLLDHLGTWPAVHHDADAGCWRMLYPGSGFPLTIMGAESTDGLHWQPLDCPEIQPPGEKLSPHHLFTVENANGGPVHIDPAGGERRYSFFCVQRGGPVGKRAELDPDSPFHEVVRGAGVRPWMAENHQAISADGLHWRLTDDIEWEIPNWHPDPPLCRFYNPLRQREMLVTRPGWGDRPRTRHRQPRPVPRAAVRNPPGLRRSRLRWQAAPTLLHRPDLGSTRRRSLPLERWL